MRNIFFNYIMDKGYYSALEEAHGDRTKVKYNYGWYCVDHIYGPEYDEDGLPIAFT